MRLPNDDTTEPALRAIGADAAALLCAGDIAGLVRRFGYALAFHRDPAFAVWEDLGACLEQFGASRLEPRAAPGEMQCRHFAAEDSSLCALLEILIPTDNGRRVRVELIVTGLARERHITLEQISAGEA